MARKVELVCDVCKKPTERIVAKLLFIPFIPGVNRGNHTNYTHHLDVGNCCKQRLLKGFNFRKRVTNDEYNKKRKTGAIK